MFADELVGCQAFEGLQSSPKVVGADEVGEVISELVVVVESMQGEDDMRALFRSEVKPRHAKFEAVGHYNQEI